MDNYFLVGQTNEQTSTTSKGAIGCRRADIARAQNVLVIWLDNNIDEGSEDCRNTITEPRRVVNAVSTFTDADECIEFIIANNNEKICMIISGALGQLIVPLVHPMSHVDSIFIFCDNKKRHEQWTKEWPKIKGVFTEISPICDALKQAAQQCEHNATSISFMATGGGASSNTNLDQLNCSFMYTQILKEILLTIPFEQKQINELTSHCREVFAGNDTELKNVKKLELKYRENPPIWWYTFECFLYPMLNRALRTMDVNIIIMMGFFISDLHRHIERLHVEQFGDHPQSQLLTVYRGQGLSKTDFDQLVKTKGGLMAFNSFLSTSKDRDVSFAFAESNQINPDMVGILFMMSIDPSLSSTPFASINGISNFTAEDEILFSMHTVFRIREIKSIDEIDRLWQVDLTLTSDNDKDLRDLTESVRHETEGSNGWYRLGQLLLKMGQSEKAQQVYEVMLEQTSDDHAKGNIYDRLGVGKYNQGQYKEAIIFYEQSLEIRQKTLPPTHPDLANSYHNIGSLYDEMGQYSKALSYYEKYLQIRQKTLPPTHPDLANSYHNIGSLYDEMGQYSKALSYYEKYLQIRQKTLPPTHPDLAVSYNNIGTVYYNMGGYSKALWYYEKSLEIQQKTLPPTHPDLAVSYNNSGAVYDEMGEYSKALWYYEKALEIQQKTLRPTHPSLAMSYINIGMVYYDVGEYSKALSYYEKALEIQKTLRPTHPSLAMSYNNIGLVYYKTGEYSKALSYYEKSLEIRQKTLPPTHPDLASSYNNIGNVHHTMGEYSRARSFYECAVDIGQHSLPTDHPHLQLCRRNLDLVKKKL